MSGISWKQFNDTISRVRKSFLVFVLLFSIGVFAGLALLSWKVTAVGFLTNVALNLLLLSNARFRAKAVAILEKEKLLTAEPDQVREREIEKAPGWILRKLVYSLYSRQTAERVFDPLFSDFETEYFEALCRRGAWKARWIRARFYFDFARTIERYHGLCKKAVIVVAGMKLLLAIADRMAR